MSSLQLCETKRKAAPSSGKKAKVTIAGAGAIGATIAYSLALKRAETEIILTNRNERKAWAKAFDISHCMPELRDRSIDSSGVEGTAGSDAIVLTLGALPKANGTRADVLKENVPIYRDLVPTLARLSPEAVLIVITNPVDAMTYATYKLSGYPPERVIGSGTELDSMRLRSFAAEALGLDAGALSMEIAGEHGESMFPLWSRAEYELRPLAEAGVGFDEAKKAELLRRTRQAAWEIRQAGEHSCYGIALAGLRILEGILDPSERTLMVSSALRGEYGIDGPFMSLPTRLCRAGVADRLSSPLPEEELAALRASAASIQAQMDEVDALLTL
jgi:L-lactate dehydrogenase